jgi:hypothetical protein
VLQLLGAPQASGLIDVHVSRVIAEEANDLSGKCDIKEEDVRRRTSARNELDKEVCKLPPRKNP